MSSRSKLGLCPSCGGFLPPRTTDCVHCQEPGGAARPQKRGAVFERLRIGALGGAFGGGAIAFTLMACYGMPPCDECVDTDDAGTDGRSVARPDVGVDDPIRDAGKDATARPDGGDAGDDSDGGDAGDAG